MIELAGSEHDWPALDSLWLKWTQASTGSRTRPLWASVVPAAAARDEAALRRALAEGGNGIDPYAGWAVAAFAENPAAARVVVAPMLSMARSPADRSGIEWTLGAIDLAAGRWRSASRELKRSEEEASRAGNPSAREFMLWTRAACGALPPLPVPRADLLALRDEIFRWDPSLPMPGATPGPLVSLRPHLRLYLLGILDARLGALDAALIDAAALERLSTSSEARGVALRLLSVVRATVASQREDADAAREILERVPGQLPMAYDALVFVDVQARWLRAEALRATGRDLEALQWYDAVPQASHAFGRTLQLALLGPSLLRSAEINEHLGNTSEARGRYARFIDLWANADPPAQGLVRTASERAARLRER